MKKPTSSMSFELIILSILLLIFIAARMVHPGKSQQGETLNGATNASPQEEILTIATFNVQTGKGLDGKRDIQNSARALSNADIAGVQEVYGAGWLNKAGIGISQTESLAKPGGFANLFAATRYRWFREQRGNLLLSKIPVQSWRIEMLPDQSRKSPRNLTIAKFLWQDTEFVFLNTHLHTGKGREIQLQTVLEEFSKHPRAILVGDFNSKPDTALLLDAFLDTSIIDAIKSAGLDLDNTQRIDWILSKGFEVVGGEMLEKGISDHPYYQVSLRLTD